MLNCSKGDATSVGLEACTIWTGEVYSAHKADRTIRALVPEHFDAPDAVIPSGFGPALRRPKQTKASDLRVVPWDLFNFRECVAG